MAQHGYLREYDDVGIAVTTAIGMTGAREANVTGAKLTGILIGRIETAGSISCLATVIAPASPIGIVIAALSLGWAMRPASWFRTKAIAA